jgi:ADP-ribosyl-[dinitrogen reductase] hydrolase
MGRVESQRAIGALLGSAIGDALGAPFEFGPAGQFTRRFPKPALGPSTEMIGGGSFDWAPGEFTDDTQMALILAKSLLENGVFDGADVFARFQAWAKNARDVGAQTRSVLHNGDWQHSADRHFEQTGHAAGNGSLMRATTSALFSSDQSIDAALTLALAQSALTHGDPAAGWGAALYHGMVRAALRGDSALDELPALLDRLPSPHAERYQSMLLSDVPLGDEPRNGSVWTCLAQAVRVLRQSSSFEEAMRQVCDIGGDVDTVACVTGGLAGATFGVQGIPSRWVSHVHGNIEGRDYRNRDLQRVALHLIRRATPALAQDVPARGPTEIRPGIFTANVLGALRAPTDAAILSLCRVENRFHDRQHRREFFLIDQENANPGLDTVLTDTIAEIDAFRAARIPVVVHCHAGESRTSFVLRAWIMQHEQVDANEATARLNASWPHVKEHNADFEQALVRLAN